jgi:hypothetical protein
MVSKSHSRTRAIVLMALTLIFVIAAHWIFVGTRLGKTVSKSVWGLNLQYYMRLMEQASRVSQAKVEDDELRDQGDPLCGRPRLSHPTGRYTERLFLSADAAGTAVAIHYSLDGSIPTAGHPILDTAIEIDRTSAVRMRTYGRECAPSRTVSATYVVAEQWDVPILSLVMDPTFLFDKHSGIYANPFRRGRAWERPVSLALIGPMDRILESEVRIRIHGNVSRGGTFKNFRLYTSDERPNLRSWFGDDAPRISETQSEWILRRSNNRRQLYSDRLAVRVAHQMGLPVSPVLPCVVYLNGKRWGVYDLMERMNAEFAAGKRPGTAFEMLRPGSLAYPVPKKRSYRSWKSIYDFIVETNPSDSTAWARIDREIDIDNLIDYFVLSIVLADGDRPHWNVDLFHSEPSGPWWFGVWDFDAGLNYFGTYVDHDTLAWHLRSRPIPELKSYGIPDNEKLSSATTLLRSLLEYPTFRDRFVSRFETRLQGVLSSANLMETFEMMLAEYGRATELERATFEAEIVWGVPISYETRIQQIHDFLTRRPAAIKRLLSQRFSPPDGEPSPAPLAAPQEETADSIAKKAS